MSLTKHGAAHIAAGKLTRTHVDPVADRFVAWIEGKAIETAAIDALMGAADQSKDPDRVLVLAEELYAELDDYPASDGLPDYLQQTSLTAAYASRDSRFELNPVATARRGGLPRIVSLMTGSDDEAPIAVNSTITSDTTNWKVGGRGWKVTSTVATAAGITLDPIPPASGATSALTVPPWQAVCAWVYVPDITKVSDLRLYLYQSDDLAAAGTWSYNTSLAGQTLVNGWNFIRVWATFGKLTTPSSLYRVHVLAGVTAVGAEYTVGHVWLECPEKARLLMMTDRGYRTWYQNIYPDLKARGIPCTLAADCTLFGADAGTSFEVITEAEALAFAKENGNSLSAHGYDGSPTTSMTAAQLRADVAKSVKWLQARGQAGRMWRAAWVQDSAPQWTGVGDLLVGAADGGGQIADLNPWPPIPIGLPGVKGPWGIRRYGLMNNLSGGTATIDTWFANLQKTHMLAAIYTHGMDPTYQYDVSRTMWDYFLSKVDAAVSAGWLETVTFEQLFYESGGSFSQMGGAAVATWTEPDGTRVTKNVL